MQPSCMGIFAGDRPERREDEEDSCSSSSIGKDSDEDCAESEVQSSCKGPLDAMDALEEVLPVKRGISKFYKGKSKSFTRLADASSVSSIKDFAKPENVYNRKRKNLIAHANFWDKNRSDHPRDDGSGISNRPAITNSGLTLSCIKNNINFEDSCSISSSPSCNLPPLHPYGKRSTNNGSRSSPPQRNSPWRSLSLSNLQCAAATSNN